MESAPQLAQIQRCLKGIYAWVGSFSKHITHLLSALALSMEDLAASDASDVSDSVESSTASAPVCAAADSVVVCSTVAEGAAVAMVVVIVVEEPILA